MIIKPSKPLVVKNNHWYTIKKLVLGNDKREIKYYESLVGKAFLLVRVVEKGDKEILNRSAVSRIRKGSPMIYYVLDAPRHGYEDSKTSYWKNSHWEFDEIRPSTEEEIQESLMIRAADAI